MNRILLYLFGTFLVMGGLAYVAYIMGVEQRWILVGCAIVLGLGIMSAATNAKGTAKTNVVIDD